MTLERVRGKQAAKLTEQNAELRGELDALKLSYALRNAVLIERVQAVGEAVAKVAQFLDKDPQ